ncbi:hypothetical protein [Brochothrix phage ADU4]|nr:hypothetical protein [Brochothrix phage ADU4]
MKTQKTAIEVVREIAVTTAELEQRKEYLQKELEKLKNELTATSHKANTGNQTYQNKIVELGKRFIELERIITDLYHLIHIGKGWTVADKVLIFDTLDEVLRERSEIKIVIQASVKEEDSKEFFATREIRVLQLAKANGQLGEILDRDRVFTCRSTTSSSTVLRMLDRVKQLDKKIPSVVLQPKKDMLNVLRGKFKK